MLTVRPVAIDQLAASPAAWQAPTSANPLANDPSPGEKQEEDTMPGIGFSGRPR